MGSNQAVDRSARLVRRVWILIGLGVLATFAIPVVSFLTSMHQQQKDIERLNDAAQALGGGAWVPPGAVGIWDRHVQVVLELPDTKVDDSKFARLAGMPAFRHVQMLSLARTGITDKSLELLRRTQILYVLDLSGTRMTDRGLESIVKLPFLSELYLSGTGVTDAGMEVILEKAGLWDLRGLKLTDTKVTAEEKKKLLKAFQFLTITDDPDRRSSTGNPD